MKILVVTDSKVLAEAMRMVLVKALKVADTDILTSVHEDAMRVFVAEQPTHVLVFEYEEAGSRFCGRGVATWKILSRSAPEGVRLVRTGFCACAAPDFIRLPWDLGELSRALGISPNPGAEGFRRPAPETG